MLTTGFKLFFGFFIAAVAAAVLFGYTTGGNNTGPLTAGYKGAVGNQVGYVILLGAAAASGLVGVILTIFRDADATAQARTMGVEPLALPAQRPLGQTYWPFLGALGAVSVVLGLALTWALVVAGLIVVFVVAFEWAISAWADRATGDEAANRAIRNRIMGPIELPVLGVASVGIVIAGMSRVLLAVSKEAAVWVATGVAAAIMAVGIVLAMRPKISKNIAAGLVALLGVVMIAGGVVAASAGEREFHHHGEPAPKAGPPTTAGSKSPGSSEKSGGKSSHDHK